MFADQSLDRPDLYAPEIEEAPTSGISWLLGLGGSASGETLDATASRLLGLPEEDSFRLLFSVKCPLNYELWKQGLADYSSSAEAENFLDSINTGADIGFCGTRSSNLPPLNHASAEDFKHIVDADLLKERDLGRIAGPFASPPFEDFLCSPIGTVEKRNSSKRRRIHDLSFPFGGSLNDFILDFDAECCKFDDAVRLLRKHGVGAKMAKMDISSAFRHLPVSVRDRPLLGFKWRGLYWCDLCLPFGLASSPAIWFRAMKMFSFIARKDPRCKDFIFYVDDVLVVGPANSSECDDTVKVLMDTFARLGILVNADKWAEEGPPATQKTFLGLELDSNRMVVRLPSDKQQRLLALVRDWQQRRDCSHAELDSLIGHLSFASRAVLHARPFTRRFIELLKRHSHFGRIKLSDECIEDLRWWELFLTSFNGVSALLDEGWQRAEDFRLFTDASTSFGWGAVWGDHWAFDSWSKEDRANATATSRESTSWLEMAAVLNASRLWGFAWRHRKITFVVDCESVALAFTFGRSKDAKLNELIRSQHLLELEFGFATKIVFVHRYLNELADALSKGDVAKFRLLAPQSRPYPDRWPAALSA